MNASEWPQRNIDATHESIAKWVGIPKIIDCCPKADERNVVFTEHEMNASEWPQRKIDATHESIAKWG